MTGLPDIVRVAAAGIAFECLNARHEWRCGKCGRGNLGPVPKVGEACRVCGATVSVVLYLCGECGYPLNPGTPEERNGLHAGCLRKLLAISHDLERRWGL
jgi:DNA-directed RNA polymerase subunit RPC12/RpoP